MPEIVCPRCAEAHDIESMEPSYMRPDAYLEAVNSDVKCDVRESKDACAYRNADDPHGRYFLRVLLPFRVEGLTAPCSWGVWVEVQQSHFDHVAEVWDASEQLGEPGFPGILANSLSGYPETLGLRGVVNLTGPKTIPVLTLDPDVSHPLVAEQQSSVSQQRVMEWLVPLFHRGIT